LLGDAWLKDDLEAGHLARDWPTRPQHSRKRVRREELVEKTKQAVKDRLSKEINSWDHRANDLKAQELAGKTPRLNSGKARQRADEDRVLRADHHRRERDQQRRERAAGR
jgi:hypothetical protein